MFETIKIIEKLQKQPLGGPTDFVYKDRACRDYFAKMDTVLKSVSEIGNKKVYRVLETV